MVGTEGSDFLVGTPGNDVIAGLGGDDVIVSLGGDDALCGASGNDGFVPGLGDDRVDGGGGGVGVGFIELVNFLEAPGPVRVDLGAGTATGEGSDLLTNVTGVIGGRFSDALIGTNGVNEFFPGGGNDAIEGRAGDDFVGFDLGVSASLVTGAATGEGDDRMASVEGLLGSDFADVLTGNHASNYLAGDEGNDLIDGRGGNDRAFGDEGNDRVAGGPGDDRVIGDAGLLGGAGDDRLLGGSGTDVLGGGAGTDQIDGGAGADVVSYVRSRNGIQANLLVGRASGEGLDALAGIESIDGSQRRDEMLGDGRTNFLYGNSGADAIVGGANADFLDGGANASSLAGGAGRDYCLNGAGANLCEITGAPAIPPVRDRPPAARIIAAEDAASLRTGVVMMLPRLGSVSWERLTGFRERALHAVGGDGAPGGSSSDVWKLLSPLDMLLRSASPPGTSAFRYIGQPACFISRSPYRMTVGPPEQLDPAIPDGAREQVFWRGILYRHADSGKLVRVRSTPWLTAIVQGTGVPTGFPNWTNASQTTFIRSLNVTVGSGTYTWAGLIKWVRTGGQVQHHIAPHIVHTPKLQPDRSCTFGG